MAKNHDVFVVKKAEPAEQELTDQVLSVLEEALAAFLAARRREAEGLTRDILARLDAIEAQVQAIRAARRKRWRNTAESCAPACRKCWPRA